MIFDEANRFPKVKPLVTEFHDPKESTFSSKGPKIVDDWVQPSDRNARAFQTPGPGSYILNHSPRLRGQVQYHQSIPEGSISKRLTPGPGEYSIPTSTIVKDSFNKKQSKKYVPQEKKPLPPPRFLKTLDETVQSELQSLMADEIIQQLKNPETNFLNNNNKASSLDPFLSSSSESLFHSRSFQRRIEKKSISLLKEVMLTCEHTQSSLASLSSSSSSPPINNRTTSPSTHPSTHSSFSSSSSSSSSASSTSSSSSSSASSTSSSSSSLASSTSSSSLN